MHQLFGVEFVDGALDHAPVAQIDASLGESAAICAPGPQQFSSPKAPRKVGTRVATASTTGPIAGVEGEAQPPAHHYSK
jgi:hypothetical protein